MESFEGLFRSIGYQIDWVTLDVILPVGISFYTFQALSYTIDVYKKKLPATHDIVEFFTYICFFPQLVAGPIERATNLLPQFQHNRTFNYDRAVDGAKQILWGFVKKILIADRCAIIVDFYWNQYQEIPGLTLLILGVLFTFQIYCDFSGYSDIAIGCAKLFGIQLTKNFDNPYFSRSIPEFWRRWHISLITWFRDYIYIPLGGSRCSKWKVIRNVFSYILLCRYRMDYFPFRLHESSRWIPTIHLHKYVLRSVCLIRLKGIDIMLCLLNYRMVAERQTLCSPHARRKIEVRQMGNLHRYCSILLLLYGRQHQ